MVLIYRHGREIIGYEVELYDRPGVLKKVLEIFAKYNINITYIERYSALLGPAYFFIAADYTGLTISPYKILEELKRLKNYVKNVTIASQLGDIIYSSNIHIKDIGGERAITFGLSDMKGLLNGIRKKLGISMGSSLLYHIGYGVGKECYQHYTKNIEIKDLNNLIAMMKAILNANAWGYITDYKVEENRLILRIENLWECETMKNETEAPASYYVKGFLSGLVDSFLNKKVVTREKKCIALGDPYCEFEINI